MQSRPTLVFPTWAKIATVTIIISLAVLLLRAVGGLITPFVWAIVTAYLFNPVVTALNTRLRIGRVWWVVLLYVVGGGAVALGINWLVPRLANQYTDFIAALPSFATRIETLSAQLGTFTFANRTFHLQPGQADIQAWFTQLSRDLPASVPELVLGVFERLVLLLVFLVVTFYLLVQADLIIERVYSLIPLPYRQEIRELGRSIDRVLGAYIRSQALLIVLMTVLTYLALSILDIKYALVLALATGFLEIIPFVGPYTAAGAAITVALLQGSTPFGWPVWLLVAVVGTTYLVLRQMEDQLIIPNLVGHIVELHPVVIIFSILAGGALAGGLGLLLAVPVAATTRIILTYLYSKLINSPESVAMVKAQEHQMLVDPFARDEDDAEAWRVRRGRVRVYRVPDGGQK